MASGSGYVPVEIGRQRGDGETAGGGKKDRTEQTGQGAAERGAGGDTDCFLTLLSGAEKFPK